MWIVLFSCLVTRLIYITIIPNRNTESFLRALKELSGRYSEPRLIYSDNEGAFSRTNEMLKKITDRPEMKAKLLSKGITWKFIPSRASSMGGIYERMVGIIKKEIMKMQSRQVFDEYDWRAHMIEIESVINDRPLTYVSDKEEEPAVITPKAIFSGNSTETILATDVNIDEIIIDYKRFRNQPIEIFKKKKRMKEIFWKKFKK